MSTHVLDSALGRPSAGVPVRLERAADGELVAEARTDSDGRVRELSAVPAGVYRLVFDTGAYFAATGQRGFYPEVSITFEVAEGHYHVPLLLSPFAFSTYRGS